MVLTICRNEFQKEYQISIWNLLQKHDCDNSDAIYSKFKLKSVCYKDDKKSAWLCEEHYDKGLNSNDLDPFYYRPK